MLARVTEARRPALEQLIAADPLVNAVIAARLAALRTVEPTRLGGVLIGVSREGDRGLCAAAFHGGNLLPIGGGPDDWQVLGEHLADGPRHCTSIVGRAPAVTALWSVLEPRWGPPRAIRERQPLLVLRRGDALPVDADRRLRVMGPADIDRYLPAAAAMFSEELGVSPFAGPAGVSYRRRIEGLLAGGRAFGIVDADGRMAFKADLGALTSATCQVQGVWVRPDLRGRGLGTAALAGVLQHGLRLAPSVSLYVNEFNLAARRMYARLGMAQVASLATVLF